MPYTYKKMLFGEAAKSRLFIYNKKSTLDVDFLGKLLSFINKDLAEKGLPPISYSTLLKAIVGRKRVDVAVVSTPEGTTNLVFVGVTLNPRHPFCQAEKVRADSATLEDLDV
jgi:hypothetical protein